ncbi:hypothetical protein Hanom_Chr17g01562691 [Helianthus anomalus]
MDSREGNKSGVLQCCCRLLEGARLSLVNRIMNKTMAGIVTGGMRKGSNQNQN